jgi:hypothetical protein
MTEIPLSDGNPFLLILLGITLAVWLAKVLDP